VALSFMYIGCIVYGVRNVEVEDEEGNDGRKFRVAFNSEACEVCEASVNRKRQPSASASSWAGLGSISV
jgi:hypothetical protein